MNDKFFDLKKEKQDRILNAALKVFSENGYRHASTEAIVSEAGISKGLLFHYFGSKLGVYSYLYEYCVRFMLLEIDTDVPRDLTDYFQIMEAWEKAKYEIYRVYPYLLFFVEKSFLDELGDEFFFVDAHREQTLALYDRILGQVDQSLFRSDIDISKLHCMLQYTLKGLMTEHLSLNVFQPEALLQESLSYIDMTKILSYPQD